MDTWTIIVRRRNGLSFGTRILSGEGESPRELFERTFRRDVDLPGVDTGLPYDLYCTELHDEYEVVAAFEGAHQPLKFAGSGGEPVAGNAARSEQAQVRRMVRRLRERGISAAEEISTGGGCFAVQIPLSRWDDLHLTIASGEDWSWQVYRDGEQTMAGTWPGCSLQQVAKHVKRLTRSLGAIVA
jgi:hypothetical protein